MFVAEIAKRIFRRVVRIAKGEWWWQSWAVGVALSWATWIGHMAIVISLRDDGDDLDPLDLSLALIVPLAGSLLVPAIYMAAGLCVLVRRALKGWGAAFATPLEPALAFLFTGAAGALAFCATGESVEHVATGIIIHCIAGQMSAGLYLPFAASVAGAYCCSRSCKAGWISLWTSVAFLGWFSGSVVGLALGNA